MTEQSNAELIAEANAVSTNDVVANPRRYRNLIGRLAAALEDADQRAKEAVSQRNRAYRQRGEEREAKEGNIRALNRVTEERNQYAAVVEKVHRAVRPKMDPEANIRRLWEVYEVLATAPADALREHDAKVRAEAYKAAEDAAADALTTWWLQETLPADDTDSVMDVRRAIRAAKAKREAGLK